MSHVKEIQLYPTPLRTGHREGEYSLFCFVLSSPGLQKKKNQGGLQPGYAHTFTHNTLGKMM